jgi:hypothetical protein
MKCIWCGEEIPDDAIKQHIAEKHLGIKNATPLQVAPTFMIAPKTTTLNTTDKPEQQLTEKEQIKEIPKLLNSEKPKKRYLKGDEIITLLHNTNKQFLNNEVSGCPLTKENE